MHIAIIADNIADRKHFERLLGRANNTLSKEIGTLYIDSYGDVTSLLKTPMKYDVIFIDLTKSEEICKDLIEQLRSKEIIAELVICQEESTPFSYQTIIDGLFCIYKPIQPNSLHKLIIDLHQDQKQKIVPTMEIRGENETHYVPLDQIVYAESRSHIVTIYLSDNTTLTMLGEIDDFYRWVESHTEFVQIKKDMVINSNHVISESKKQYVLTNKIIVKRKSFPFF